MILIISIIIGYILNVLINRWIYFQVSKNDRCKNEIGIFFCFLSIIGTLLLIVIYLIEDPTEFFTPPHLRKNK